MSESGLGLPQIYIGDKPLDYKDKAPVMIISNSMGKAEIRIKPEKFLWKDWRFISQIEKFGIGEFHNFLFNFSSYIDGKEGLFKNEVIDFNYIWRKISESNKRVMDLSLKFRKIVKLVNIINEKDLLEEKLSKILIERKLLAQKEIRDIIASKKDFLADLESQISYIEPVYNERRSRFERIKKELEDVKRKRDGIEEELNSLKDRQRELYGQTNALTEKIDEKSELIQIYSDKLFDIKNKNKDFESNPDYIRIKEKLDNINKELDPIREMRNNLMKQSQKIKGEIIRLKRKKKELGRLIKQKENNFNGISEEFRSIESEYKVMSDKIGNLKREIADLIDKDKLKKEFGNDNVEDDLSAYVSDENLFNTPDGLEMEERRIKERLSLIEKRLISLFETDNKEEILKELEKKAEKINSAVKREMMELKEFIASIYSSTDESSWREVDLKIMDVRNYLMAPLEIIFRKSKQIKKIWNIFLKKMDIYFDFLITISGEDKSEMNMEIKFFKKGKELNWDEFAKNERSYILFSLLITMYLVNGINTILLNTDYLPHGWITPKTLYKIIGNIRSALNEFQSENPCLLVIFLTKSYPEITSDLIIED